MANRGISGAGVWREFMRGDERNEFMDTEYQRVGGGCVREDIFLKSARTFPKEP